MSVKTFFGPKLKEKTNVIDLASFGIVCAECRSFMGKNARRLPRLCPDCRLKLQERIFQMFKKDDD